MGALFTQKIAAARWDEFVPWLRSAPASWSAPASMPTDGLSGSRATTSPPSSWSATSRQGLPAAYEAECDLLVKMPMLGKADSLNAAVAAAVMAYEVINQWRQMKTCLLRCSSSPAARPCRRPERALSRARHRALLVGHDRERADDLRDARGRLFGPRPAAAQEPATGGSGDAADHAPDLARRMQRRDERPALRPDGARRWSTGGR